MRSSFFYSLIVGLQFPLLTVGFQSHGINVAATKSFTSSSSCSVTMQALTERQMQFWEDVDEGLDDIENFYGVYTKYFPAIKIVQ